MCVKEALKCNNVRHTTIEYSNTEDWEKNIVVESSKGQTPWEESPLKCDLA